MTIVPYRRHTYRDLLHREDHERQRKEMTSTLDVVSLFGVKGRVAVVTGGSSGVGFMIAKVKRLS
jgi:hypothetical protein